MEFSERIGAAKRTVQFQTITDRLKNRLWNIAYRMFWEDMQSGEYTRSAYRGKLLIELGADFFALPQDEIQGFVKNAYFQIKVLALNLEWARFYDLLEFFAVKTRGSEFFARSCNDILKEELSGYRFVGLQLAPITSSEEIASVEDAIAQSGPFAPASTHISTALARLADRPQPDSRNSIKESISGVEAVCQTIVGDSKATLGQALKKLKIHSALEKGFSAIYGYTSEADGIRHALLDEPTVDVDDAKFFLVSCSAFINYLIARFASATPPLSAPYPPPSALARSPAGTPARRSPVSAGPAPNPERSAG
jgi:hypothetical protein